MVATYTIFGRQVGSHVLAMLTLGTTAAGSWYAMSGPSKKPESKPPINAGSSDEEKFIKDFLQTNTDSSKGVAAKAAH